MTHVAVRKGPGEDESLAELLGLEVRRVDLVGAPAIRRRFVLTKAQGPNNIEMAASTKRWSQFTDTDYSLEQMARACPRPCVLWAVREASDGGREVAKSELSLRYREPDGTPNIWGIRAALKQLSVTELPAAVKSDAEAELRLELEKVEQALGKEDDDMVKAAKVVEDMRDVASRIALEKDEEALAGLRKEAGQLLGEMSTEITGGRLETGAAGEAIETLESALAKRKLLPGADTNEDEEDAGVDGEAVTPEAVTEPSTDEETEDAGAGDEKAISEATAAPEAAVVETEAPAEEPAAETSVETSVAAPAAEEAVEAAAEIIEQAEGMSEDEQSTLLRALQAIAPFKSKLPGGAFEQMAQAVGYKAKSAEDVELPELDTLLKSDLPEPVMKALNAIPLLKSQLERANAALELEQGAREEAVTKLTKAEAEQLERVSLEKARKVALIGVKNEDLAALLVKTQKADPELAEQLFAILKTANDQVRASGLFDVLGTTAPAPDSPEGRIEAIARESIAKSEAGLSFEVAKAQAWKDHPELYAEYQKSHKERQARRG